MSEGLHMTFNVFITALYSAIHMYMFHTLMYGRLQVQWQAERRF